GAAKACIGEPKAHGPANGRLVFPDQFGGRLLVTLPDPADQVAEGQLVRHGASSGPRWPRSPGDERGMNCPIVERTARGCLSGVGGFPSPPAGIPLTPRAGIPLTPRPPLPPRGEG